MKRRNGREFKREMKRLIGQSFERLESRYCLTVAAAVTGGNLVVSGDADGAVAIHEDSAGTFSVTDNGVAGKEGDDTVSVAAGASIGRSVMAVLGNGDNSVSMAGDVSREVSVVTGSGDDKVEVTADGTIGRSLSTMLGGGDNTLTIDGAV